MTQQSNPFSRAKSMTQFPNINGPSDVLVSVGERSCQGDVSSVIFWKFQLNGQRAGGCSRDKGCKSEMDREREVVPETRGARVKWTESGRLFQRQGAQEWNALAPALVFDPKDQQWFLCLISVNGMGVIEQALSEDKQVVSHEEFCRSANRSWNSTLKFPGKQWREHGSGTLRVNDGDFVTTRTSYLLCIFMICDLFACGIYSIICWTQKYMFF